MLRVDQLMSRPVITCRVSDNLSAVTALMWDHDCGVVPVVDDAGTLAGIVTDRDVAMAAYTQGRALAEIPVGIAMAANVLTCRADDKVATAENVMEAHQVRRLPVIDADGRPVGLLALSDLARGASHASASQSGMLMAFARTLAAICRPRGNGHDVVRSQRVPPLSSTSSM